MCRRDRTKRAGAVGAIGVVLLAVLIGLPGCRRLASKFGVTFVPLTTVRDERPLAPVITNLHVDVRAGKISVLAGPSGVISVEADVKINESLFNLSADPGTFDDHVRISEAGQTITVADAHSGQADEKNWRVSFTVRVPATLSVHLASGAGTIAIQDMTADIEASSGAGKIALRTPSVRAVMLNTSAGAIEATVGTITGPITAHVAAGAIRFHIRDAAPSKDVKLTAAVGDIHFKLPPNTPGTFALESTVGRITVTGHPEIRVKRVAVGAEATGTVGTGVPTYTVEAAAGSITIE